MLKMGSVATDFSAIPFRERAVAREAAADGAIAPNGTRESVAAILRH